MNVSNITDQNNVLYRQMTVNNLEKRPEVLRIEDMRVRERRRREKDCNERERRSPEPCHALPSFPAASQSWFEIRHLCDDMRGQRRIPVRPISPPDRRTP